MVRWFSSKTMQRYFWYYRQKSRYTYDIVLHEIYFNLFYSVKRTFTQKRLSWIQSISLESTSTWIYPDDCNFCHEIKMKHQGHFLLPRKIAIINATVKESAKINDSSLYAGIADLDLKAKELKYHQVFHETFSREYLSCWSINWCYWR